jgi:Cu2+-exporting ATPase/Cu+-exporting ATPase
MKTLERTLLGVPNSSLNNIIKVRCTHCSEQVLESELIVVEEKPFCCHGCAQVYSLLHDNDLIQFYDILDGQKRSPVDLDKNFRYLDDFTSEYLAENQVRCVVKNMDCVACVWLLERLPQVCDDIQSTKVNFNESLLFVEAKKGVKLSRLFDSIHRLGFELYPLKTTDSAIEIVEQNRKKQLIRFGVTGAIAGNIMLFSTANYLGASGDYARFFDWAGLVLSIPIITYSSLPFYQAVWKNLKQRQFSIDIPIVFSLIVGWVSSAYFILSGQLDLNYIDTLSVLVFLILGSRYALFYYQRKLLAKMSLTDKKIEYARRKNSRGQYQWASVSEVKKGDRLEFHQQETLLFDGVLKDQSALFDMSFITGESEPVKVEPEQEVKAGSILLGTKAVIEVTEEFEKSYINDLEKRVQKIWQSQSSFSSLLDKAAKLLVLIVLLSCGYIFLMDSLSFSDQLSRVLAVAIITCPCALGLAPTIVSYFGLSSAFKRGIIVKDSNVFEKLLKVKNALIDKTGTLTTGQMSIEKIEGEMSTTEASILYTLEFNSPHPVAQAIRDHIQKNFSPDKVEGLKVSNIPKGLIGNHNGDAYQVAMAKLSRHESYFTVVTFSKNNQDIMTFYLSDFLRKDSRRLIDFLNSHSIDSIMISGDNENSCRYFSNLLGVKKWYSQSLPEDKLEIAQCFEKNLMIGDGLNDSLALSQSSVAIAMNPEMNLSLKVSDVLIPSKNVKQIINLFQIAKNIRYMHFRNIIFTLIYNAFGIYMAINGMIHPLLAAVLMPISSLMVLFMSFYGTKKLKQVSD